MHWVAIDQDAVRLDTAGSDRLCHGTPQACRHAESIYRLGRDMGHADSDGDICDLCCKHFPLLRRQLFRIVEAPDLGICRQDDGTDGQRSCYGATSDLVDADDKPRAAELFLEGIHLLDTLTFCCLLLVPSICARKRILDLLSAVILIELFEGAKLLEARLMQLPCYIACRLSLLHQRLPL